MPSQKWKKTHRARRRLRRRGRKRQTSDEQLIHYYLTTLLGPALMPKPPVDPYARGNVVPPMKTAQKTSYEVAHRARGGAKPLWGHRPYDPEFGNLSGITRSTVPIWSSQPQLFLDPASDTARRAQYRRT